MSPCRRLVLTFLIAAGLAGSLGTASAAARTVWLCNPMVRPDPCTADLTTSVFSPSGALLAVRSPAVSHPRIDCFYVYPTVSDQPTPLSNLHIDPAERSIALLQAARFSRYCRVFAPVYRQKTWNALASTSRAISLADVRAAWFAYLRRYNKGRGVVLIGHSQGSVLLTMLIASEIDPKRAVRRKLVSAILLGGNVTVRQGSDVGGDFRHIPTCRSRSQLGCVIAYSTFDGPVPPTSQVGLATPPQQVVCTNPAALGGGAGMLDSIYPTRPFAPGSTWANALQMLGLGLPSATTPWIEIAGAYSAQCSLDANYNVLQVVPVGGAPALTPAPGPTWGLHFVDANIALGNLVSVVGNEARVYAVTHGA